MGIFGKTVVLFGKNALKEKYKSQFSIDSVKIDTEDLNASKILVKYNIKKIRNESDHDTGDLLLKIYLESLDKKGRFLQYSLALEKLGINEQYPEINDQKEYSNLPESGNYNLIISISEYTTQSKYEERYQNSGNFFFKHPRDNLAADIALKIFENPNYENELKYGIPQYFYIKEKYVKDRIYLFDRSWSDKHKCEVKKGEPVGEVQYCLRTDKANFLYGGNVFFSFPFYEPDYSKKDEEIVATHDGLFEYEIKLPKEALKIELDTWVRVVLANVLNNNKIEVGVIHLADELFYNENRALIYSYLEELKQKEYEEQEEQKKELKKQLELQKQQETKKIHEEQEQKKLEREEDARETAFQKNLKSISEDIDALELAAGKGVFNIQQLTILENHLSVLAENKSIFNENNKNILKRKKKYLEAIFRDCEQLPDCKGSSKIRMEEILKMLDDLSSFEE